MQDNKTPGTTPRRRKRRQALPTHDVVLVSKMIPPGIRARGSKHTQLGLDDVYTALTGDSPIVREDVLPWLIGYRNNAGERPYLGLTTINREQ